MPQPGNSDRPGLSGSPELLRTLALLGSLCLFLSAVEYLIPKPLPFMRIGLANFPLLLALGIFKQKDFFLLALIKVLGQGIINGTFFSYVFLFSLAGTFSSAAVMYGVYALFGKKHLGFAGIGCAGAMASNAIQLVLARYFIFGPALRYMAPPFLASGFITGIALGIICEYFCRHSIWYLRYSRFGHTGSDHSMANETSPIPLQEHDTVEEGKKSLFEQWRLQRSSRWNNFFNAGGLFAAGLLITLVFLINRTVEIRIVHFMFFYLLAWFSGKKNNVFITLLIMAGIVLCNLLVPYGKVLAVIGPLQITQGSLYSGLEKAFTLGGLIMISRAFIKADLRLPGPVGSLLAESLRILEQMREKKSMFGKGNLITNIDTMLLELETQNTYQQKHVPGRKMQRNLKSIFLLITMILITAAITVSAHCSL